MSGNTMSDDIGAATTGKRARRGWVAVMVFMETVAGEIVETVECASASKDRIPTTSGALAGEQCSRRHERLKDKVRLTVAIQNGVAMRVRDVFDGGNNAVDSEGHGLKFAH
jgi:hypothetical protein